MKLTDEQIRRFIDAVDLGDLEQYLDWNIEFAIRLLFDEGALIYPEWLEDEPSEEQG